MRLGIFWSASVATFLAAVFIGLIANLPELGLTREVAAELGYGLKSRDTMVDTPRKVMAAGAIYFGAMAYWKLLGAGLPFKSAYGPSQASTAV
jgi:hypothetical protein